MTSIILASSCNSSKSCNNW